MPTPLIVELCLLLGFQLQPGGPLVAEKPSRLEIYSSQSPIRIAGIDEHGDFIFKGHPKHTITVRVRVESIIKKWNSLSVNIENDIAILVPCGGQDIPSPMRGRDIKFWYDEHLFPGNLLLAEHEVLIVVTESCEFVEIKPAPHQSSDATQGSSPAR